MTFLTQLQNKMKQNGIFSGFIDNPQYIDYFTGFYNDSKERILALIVFQEDAYLFAPHLEVEAAKKETGLPIVSYFDEENPWEVMDEQIFSKYSEIKNMGIEQDSLTVNKYLALKNSLSDLSFFDISPLIQELTVIKKEQEIELLNEAGRLANEAIRIGIQALEEGISEKEVVALIEYNMKKMGADDMSFATMVLFGDHAASPHGKPGNRKLKNDEFVLFDLGVEKDGYTSDVTRTVAFGQTTEEMKEIYNIVLKAQIAAQKSVKPGVKAKDIDHTARKIIEDAGYGEYFSHRLGHGLGKSVHEYPSITSNNEMIIEKGMCFSIEPGIYIPGKVGVRIEDCIYVTEDGCKPFTHHSKEFKQI